MAEVNVAMAERWDELDDTQDLECQVQKTGQDKLSRKS